MNTVMEVVNYLFSGGWAGIAIVAFVVFRLLSEVPAVIAKFFEVTPGTPDGELLSKSSKFMKRVAGIIAKILGGDASKIERRISRMSDSVTDALEDNKDKESD